ncbi:MAG: [NiFe]-hydrogenase assembly chaperone HybE [Actinomycetota bacterium]
MANPLSPEDAARVDRLVATFRRIGDERMRDLALYNAKLGVEAVGFRRLGEWLAGVLVTPWFMNFIMLPPAPEALAGSQPGTRRKVVLPRGEETFTVGEVEDVGPYLAVSIHSPMGQFPDHTGAATAAWAAVEGFFRPKDDQQQAADCSFGWPEHAR